MSDGGLDDNGDTLISKREYYTWIKKVTKGSYICVENIEQQEYLKTRIKGVNILQVEDMDDLNEDVYILGGEELYNTYLEDVEYLHLLEVSGVVESVEHFPEFNIEGYDVVSMEDFEGKKFWGVEKVYQKVKQEVRETKDIGKQVSIMENKK